MIFDHLGDEDLLRCETVCRQWRIFLLSGRPWRRLLHRQIVSSPQWRNILRFFGVDVKKLETVHYRGLGRAISQELKQVDRNWRNGNFKKISVTADFCFQYCSPYVTFGDDRNAVYLASYDMSLDLLQIVHRTSLQLISSMEIRDGSSAVSNAEIIVRWDTKNIKILDINGQLIYEVPELDENELISWNLASCCLSRDQMAVLSQSDGKQKLSLWDVRDPLRATRLKSNYSHHDL
jgi:F-box-like